jgi:hypothetical protein
MPAIGTPTVFAVRIEPSTFELVTAPSAIVRSFTAWSLRRPVATAFLAIFCFVTMIAMISAGDGLRRFALKWLLP